MYASDLEVGLSQRTETALPGPGTTVVGIGASAGGLAALRRLFLRVPEDSGLAYVVVVHLSPEHESHLAELLQPHVRVPVQQVAGTVPLEPNHVYVIPPNRNLSTIDTHLRLSDLEEDRRERAPIDHFLRTLARTHEERAIGVILTGTGSDGALGLKSIKEKGGLTVVQDPGEAEYDGMPQSAVSTGVVDLVLPLDEIAEAVISFASTCPRVGASGDGEDPEQAQRRALQNVFAVVQERTGRDFSRYKRSTILRRIARRMQMRRVETLPSYLKLLHDGEEAPSLADDLLITVTSFFRDPEVFERIEKDVLPRLFLGKGPEDEVRVWSVGCATGEEAYSLAMQLLDEARNHAAPPRVQVFASDLHEGSLERARTGFYSGDVASVVGEERLQRYFQKVNGGYRIKPEVREVVVFAAHNFLVDPPFSRIDLIACRNVLIYLQRAVQRDVIGLFHFALRQGGYLVLGTSETVDGEGLFLVEDDQHCIYRKHGVRAGEPRLPVFPRTLSRPTAEHGLRTVDARALGLLHQRLLERQSTPTLLVGPEDDVVRISERAGRYLLQPGGEPTGDLYQLLPETLRPDLRSAVHRARKEKQLASTPPIVVSFNGEEKRMVLHARPAIEPRFDGFVLVAFDEREATGKRAPADPDAGDAGDASDAGAASREHALEAELQLSRRHFKTLAEEYDTSREEMKAANEELQSANEELRSTMEELETGKEELQSLNEELQTVNQENRHRVEELAQLSGDLQNLLTATEIATLFLDRDLRILRFTPKVGELFNMRSTDRGRPLSDLTHRLGYHALREDALRVLETLVPVEREVQDAEGRWYLARVMPYRSSEDRIEGVVLTFVDVSHSKEAEGALRESGEKLQVTLTAARAGVWEHDLEAGRTSLDSNARAVLGVDGEILDPGALLCLVPPEDRERATAAFRSMLAGEQDFFAVDVRIQQEPPGPRWIHVRGRALSHGQGATRKASRLVGVVLDVTERKLAEEVLRDADRRKSEFLAMLGHELRNPLAAMRNAFALLEASGRQHEAGAVPLGMMERQLEQLVRLIDDLLDLSRIGLDKLRLRPSHVDLETVLRHALEGSRARSSDRRVELVPPGAPVTVHGDPARLAQVFANLLNNAYDFTTSGGRIVLRAERQGGEVVVTVEDDGAGIPPEELERIFGLFAQLHPSREERGLGLGLALVKRLVEMHGGRVEATSAGLGRGAAFVVHLPVAAALPAPAAPAANAPVRPADLTGLRVLVVDDNRDVARSLGMLLEHARCKVAVAFDGEEALGVAEGFRPEIVLLDIGLPGMDGYEVARRIRERDWGRDAIVAALTGLSQDSDRERSSLSGFDLFVVKPVDHEVLKRRLADARAKRAEVEA